MEKQQDSPPAILCRAGCGFFGHQAFENYCSKCYNSHSRQMQAQQQAVASVGPVANSSASSLHALTSSSSSASLSSSTHTFASSSLSASQTDSPSTMAAASAHSTTSEPVPIPAPSSSSTDAALLGSSLGASLGTSPADELNPAAASPNGSATKAPRRCAICNKRTGLTGFECRGCSGWHCTEHRYPDKHSCTFDYKSADRERLRREHPAVVGEKIQKI